MSSYSHNVQILFYVKGILVVINTTVLCCRYKLTVHSWATFTPEYGISMHLELEMAKKFNFQTQI